MNDFLEAIQQVILVLKFFQAPQQYDDFPKTLFDQSSSMRSISVMDNLKSKTSKLDFICSKLVAFGNGMMPRWICQRKMNLVVY